MTKKRNLEQLGTPKSEEYSDEECLKILKCKTEHEFYLTGKLAGGLKYCPDCKFGYTV
ncbi:MAG: hypothetical protein ABII39_03600 [Candidatus Micrarchaeota archaeon]